MDPINEYTQMIDTMNGTEIVCIIDKSGSMNTIREDAIGGFNAFLEDQKKLPGSATMTLVLFDTTYRFVFEGKNLQEVEPLTNATYRPGGGTALLDAVGQAIDTVNARVSALPQEEKPKVIFAILTDGEENSSHQFTREQVFEKINGQRDNVGWEFLFLAANQDAIQAASTIGIKGTHAMNFSATSDGMEASYNSMSRGISSYRAMGMVASDWKEEDPENREE